MPHRGRPVGRPSGSAPSMPTAPDFDAFTRSPHASQNASICPQDATAASAAGVNRQMSSTIRTIRTGWPPCT